MDLTKMTPARLGREIEARQRARLAAVDAVYALAWHGLERFSDVVDRIGRDHHAVVAVQKASAHCAEAEQEAERRYGREAVPFRSNWPSFLANQRRRRTIRTKG
jgi:hypothetical protein